MNLSTLPLCARAREFLSPLRAGRATEAGLLRHVGTCPRCRARLASLQRARPAPGAGYVLAVVRAAARARLAGLLAELALACAARHDGPVTHKPAARKARDASELLDDVARLERRILAMAGEDLASDRPRDVPAPGQALPAARLCLLAAQQIDGPCESRQLQLAACALLAGDDAAAGALCSDLVAAAGQHAERVRLARHAAHVARDWGLPRNRLLPLLRQPAAASCN